MPAVKIAKSASIYSVHPGVQMVMDWADGLKVKTGRTLEEWIALTKKTGPKTEAMRRDWLKARHGFGTNAAWWLAERSEGKGTEDSDPKLYLKAAAEYVEKMYAGGKAGLRPIHDALIKLGKSLGKDVKICPCQTIVPMYRNHVFAQIKPSTRTRIDFGLCLTKYKGKLPRRLIDTGGLAKKDRITHKIEITSPTDVDAEVKRWLKVAYDFDGPA
jgi:hypothetical protein